VNSDVKSHQFPKLLVFKAELVGVVCSIIQVSISGWDCFLLISKFVVVDDSGDAADLSTNVKSVFEG
jgi:hypothetical protein